jgi:hypothetical protein
MTFIPTSTPFQARMSAVPYQGATSQAGVVGGESFSQSALGKLANVLPQQRQNFNYGVYRSVFGAHVPIPGVGGNGHVERTDNDGYRIHTPDGACNISRLDDNPNCVKVEYDGKTMWCQVHAENNKVTLWEGDKSVTLERNGNGFQMTSRGLGKDKWIVQSNYA